VKGSAGQQKTDPATLGTGSVEETRSFERYAE
jgi:hypothetical protein